MLLLYRRPSIERNTKIKFSSFVTVLPVHFQPWIHLLELSGYLILFWATLFAELGGAFSHFLVKLSFFPTTTLLAWVVFYKYIKKTHNFFFWGPHSLISHSESCAPDINITRLIFLFPLCYQPDTTTPEINHFLHLTIVFKLPLMLHAEIT